MYEIVKAFHVMSVIAWFAVLFYLPRLFVYHVEQYAKGEFVEVVRIMEHKLFSYIGVPAFWATLISGLYMIWAMPELFTTGGWLHAKLTVAAVLIGYFFYLGKEVRFLARYAPQKSGKFYRILNEAPTLMMIIIVALVVVRPF
ncbi:MAG: membrane protein [Sulfuricurvum sp. PC08-66]|nr:MAG: membrane protein [Sulfuricurvum sp. PC08-66]